ncbi:MAG TPA: RNA methyltransferase, partial [Acidimicrobiales bacterium]|nr:RNA methyltransferase [Acidimicrobiales bacterium]
MKLVRMTYSPAIGPHEAVDDPADPRVADYVGLSDAAARRDVEGAGGRGFFVAEGSLVIGHLVRSPYRVRSFLVTERGLRALDRVLGEQRLAEIGAPVYLATQTVMESIAGFNFHRGALAAADRRPLPDPMALAAG